MVKLKVKEKATKVKTKLRVKTISFGESIRYFRAPGQTQPDFMKWSKENIIITEERDYLNPDVKRLSDKRIDRLSFFERQKFEKNHRQGRIRK